jgi:hypothetical protein
VPRASCSSCQGPMYMMLHTSSNNNSMPLKTTSAALAVKNGWQTCVHVTSCLRAFPVCEHSAHFS